MKQRLSRGNQRSRSDGELELRGNDSACSNGVRRGNKKEKICPTDSKLFFILFKDARAVKHLEFFGAVLASLCQTIQRQSFAKDRRI